jgi:hypothetical protein
MEHTARAPSSSLVQQRNLVKPLWPCRKSFSKPVFQARRLRSWDCGCGTMTIRAYQRLWLKGLFRFERVELPGSAILLNADRLDRRTNEV